MPIGGKYDRTRGSTEELLARFGDKNNAKPGSVKVQAWCFLCATAHRFHEPCFSRQALLAAAEAKVAEAIAAETHSPQPCKQCGKLFSPRRHPGTVPLYCTSECRFEARNARRRMGR